MHLTVKLFFMAWSVIGIISQIVAVLVPCMSVVKSPRHSTNMHRRFRSCNRMAVRSLQLLSPLAH